MACGKRAASAKSKRKTQRVHSLLVGVLGARFDRMTRWLLKRAFGRQGDSEESLAQALQRLDAFFNNTPLAVIECDEDFRISRWCGAAEAMFGWRADDVLGRQMTDFALIFEQDTKGIVAVRTQLSEGGRKQAVLRTRNRTKSGKVIDCEWYNSILEGAQSEMTGMVSLVLDVTRHRELEEKLHESILRRKEVDRRKNEFLATLAHELRNPLAPLTSALELMRRSPDDAPVRKYALDVMARQCRMMVRLIDDVLDVSRITTGKLQLKPAKVEVASVLQEAAEAAQPLVTRRHQKLVVNDPHESLYVFGDVNRLVQVVTNLLRNAAKFTNEGGNVSLSARKEGGQVVIRVCDDGMGIPAAKLATIFDLFSQAHEDSRESGIEGLGIGLHLAKRFVLMHGGTITAHSAGPGAGSEFIVELPCMHRISLLSATGA